MTIMYLTYGNKTEYHIQAYFSMLSFRKQLSEDDRIVMVTNCPQYYKKVASWVEVMPIDDKTVEEWKGKHHFVFRAKTMAMKHYIAAHPNEHLLFIDTDTFLYGRLDDIRERLDHGIGIMHKDEGHPSKMGGASLRMWKACGGKTWGGVTLDDRHNMWNSGVLGIPRQYAADVINMELGIIDDILDSGVDSFTIEQYATSVAMIEHGTLEEATPYVGHYWGNKEEWERIITTMLMRSYMQDGTPDDLLADIDDKLLRSAPIYIHKSDTAKRLRKLISRFFPDRNPQYI